MFSMISVVINVIVLLLLFGVLSKLEEVSKTVKRLAGEPVGSTEPETQQKTDAA
ncbi:MAG: hypothetical protein WDM91_04115 [Rhizomicrobium sp.]